MGRRSQSSSKRIQKATGVVFFFLDPSKEQKFETCWYVYFAFGIHI